MPKLIKRALGLLLGRSGRDEEVRYVDFAEPRRPGTELVRAVEARAAAARAAPSGADRGPPVAAPPAEPAPLPTAEAHARLDQDPRLHPDDDWFAEEPLDAPAAGPRTVPAEDAEFVHAVMDRPDAAVPSAPTDGRGRAPDQGTAEPAPANGAARSTQPGGADLEDLVSNGRNGTAGGAGGGDLGLGRELLELAAREEEPEPDLEADDATDLDVEWLFEDEPLGGPSEAAAADPDVGADWDVPDDAAESPAAAPLTPDDNAARRAGRRAAMLVNELGVERESRRRVALRWLEELLREFPHGSSHAAITRLVLGGITFEELQATAALVRLWRSDPGLWLVRRYDRLTRQHQVAVDRRSGGSGLTWVKAAKLATAVDEEEATELLTGDWRDAWLALQPEAVGSGGDASSTRWRREERSYADYASARAEALAAGPSGKAPPGGIAPDRYGWLRELDPELARAVSPDGRLAYNTAIPVRHRDRPTKGRD